MELGKALNKTEELRLMADYKGDPVEEEDAAWAVSQAQTFGSCNANHVPAEGAGKVMW